VYKMGPQLNSRPESEEAAATLTYSEARIYYDAHVHIYLSGLPRSGSRSLSELLQSFRAFIIGTHLE
jgi:hypothetical protein